jgi:hypothetical protein
MILWQRELNLLIGIKSQRIGVIKYYNLVLKIVNTTMSKEGEKQLLLVNYKIDELIKRVADEKYKSEKLHIKRLESLKTIDGLLNDLKEMVKDF